MAVRLMAASAEHRTEVLLEEACVEGMALADEVRAHVDRILMAASAGSRMAVVNEAGRLGSRAAGYRERFARMVADIEP